jgi:hypothetical protein
MPRYKILASNRFTNTYIVTAKDEDEAREAVYDEEAFLDVVIEEVGSSCVGSDILECELIEEDNADD